MLNNSKSLCIAPITQVQKYMYTHPCVCVYIYISELYASVHIYTHIRVVQKHINISYTDILFAPGKLSRLIRI